MIAAWELSEYASPGPPPNHSTSSIPTGSAIRRPASAVLPADQLSYRSTNCMPPRRTGRFASCQTAGTVFRNGDKRQTSGSEELSRLDHRWLRRQVPAIIKSLHQSARKHQFHVRNTAGACARCHGQIHRDLGAWLTVAQVDRPAEVTTERHVRHRRQ